MLEDHVRLYRANREMTLECFGCPVDVGDGLEIEIDADLSAGVTVWCYLERRLVGGVQMNGFVSIEQDHLRKSILRTLNQIFPKCFHEVK